MDNNSRAEWRAELWEELFEARADIRVLARVLQRHRTHAHTFNGCNDCRSGRDEALARPGVVRVLEKEKRR